MWIIVPSDQNVNWSTAYHVPPHVRNKPGMMRYIHDWMGSVNGKVRGTPAGADEKLRFNEWWTDEHSQAAQASISTNMPNILAQQQGGNVNQPVVPKAPGTNVSQDRFDMTTPYQQQVARVAHSAPHIDVPRQHAYATSIPGIAWGGIANVLANPMAAQMGHRARFPGPRHFG